MNHSLVTRSRKAGLGVLLLAASLGCSNAVTPGSHYRAYIATEAGDRIPFGLEVPPNCNTEAAVLVNGEERIQVACQQLGSRLLLDFPVYGTRVTAEVRADGGLTGEWGHTGGGLRDRFAFGATPLSGSDPLPQSNSTGLSPGAIAGIWRIELETLGLAKGVFEEVAEGVVRGTAEVPSEYGDLRFLAGTFSGVDLSVSSFDGGNAYLLRGSLEEDGRLRGEFVGNGVTRDTFVATRSDDFDLVDPLEQVRVTSATRRVDFEPLLSPRYAGKAVILEIFGTWCSNCNDLAPLLTDLYRAHRDEGLEMIGLAYEISEDEGYKRERVNAYATKYELDWEIVLADGLPEDLLGPAELSPIEGVPVTIFLNRDRTIRAIYTGFWGPATGATHRKAVETFGQLARDILDSPAPDASDARQ